MLTLCSTPLGHMLIQGHTSGVKVFGYAAGQVTVVFVQWLR